ncbi:MAG TPA: 5,10-methylenetetrahydrofolate reductase [Polyangia bacterium]|nr:5,10-methylenetetrahydrofolate reductase [Polyangia bacterium]
MSLGTKILERRAGLCLYGLAPPKLATPAGELPTILAQQQARLATLPVDGLIVYDLQDEAERTAAPRPFPFLPTLDPHAYAHDHLSDLSLPKIVYRCVSRDSASDFEAWLKQPRPAESGLSVLVGAPSRSAPASLRLTEAYALARQHAPGLLLGGIAIAERHAQTGEEHARILAKIEAGCRFFVSQAVYDVTSTKSLLSDYALEAGRRGVAPVPIVLTLSPCGSEKTLAFMKWLGIAFPRWLENDLLHAADPLASSVDLCERIFAEAWDYAREKGVPLGVNVESVSIRKREIEASVELLHRLRRVTS